MDDLPVELLDLLIPFLHDPLDLLSLSSVSINFAHIFRTTYTFRNHLRQVGFKNSDIIIRRAPILFHSLGEGIKEWLLLGRYAIWRQTLCDRILKSRHHDDRDNSLASFFVTTLLLSFASDSDDVIFDEKDIINHLAISKADNTVVRYISAVIMAHQLYHYMCTGQPDIPLPLRYNTGYTPQNPALYLYCTRRPDPIQMRPTYTAALLHAAELSVHLFHCLESASLRYRNEDTPLLCPTAVLKAESFEPRGTEDTVSWFPSSRDAWCQDSYIEVLGYYVYSTHSPKDMRVGDGQDRSPMRISMKMGKRDNLIQGVGTDNHGRFTIEGSRNIDSVQWRKAYDAGWSFIYYGLLMPWGIVGDWGFTAGYPQGAFYLWLKV